MYGINEIDATGLKDRLAQEKPMRLIDVRSSAEFQQGIIAGAEFIPLHTLPMRLDEFSKDEDIIFYCRTGSRSAQACMFLKQNTGIDATNLRGGIVGWYQSGYSIVSPDAA